MKFYLSAIVCICLLTQVLPVHAQRKPPTPKMGATILSSTRGKLSGVSITKRIEQLRRENAALAAKNARERQYQTQLFQRAKRATFRSHVPAYSSSNAITGTLVRSVYKGEQEVFGIVASHALQSSFYLDGLLGKEFEAVYDFEGVPLTIPATVVKVAHSSLHDIALVKFPKEYEQLFDPIELDEHPLTLPAQGYSQGYALNILSKQTFPLTGYTSVGTLTSHLPKAEIGQRSGLCGSPVFTTDFRFEGIHVGSSYSTDMGFITPAHAVRSLIKAYHVPQLRPYTLTLAGKKIGSLAVNEYVSRIEILNSQQQPLWQRLTETKFSLSEAENQLSELKDAAFVRLVVGQSSWQPGPKGTYLFDDISNPRIILTPLK